MKFFDRLLTIVITATLTSVFWIVFGTTLFDMASDQSDEDEAPAGSIVPAPVETAAPAPAVTPAAPPIMTPSPTPTVSNPIVQPLPSPTPAPAQPAPTPRPTSNGQ